MPISKAQWNHVQQRLHELYHPVELDCDGYRLSLVLVRVDQFNNAITFFVNGKHQGRWILEDCPERTRFCRPQKTKAFPARFRRSTKKEKAAMKRMGWDLDKTIITYSSYWTCFSRLRRHLERNNTTITLIEEEKREVA